MKFASVSVLMQSPFSTLLALVVVFSFSVGPSQGVPDFSIRTFHGKQCLTAVDGSSGSRVAIADCSSSSKSRAQTQVQAWTYYGYKEETPTSSFTQLQLQGSTKCLTIVNGRIILYTCMNGGVRGQVWNLRRFQHVTRILVPGYRNENGTAIGCLAVQAAGFEQVFGNGTPLVLEECDEKKNKMFLLKSG